MKRVLKWGVPVDDQPHEIGAGRVVHVDVQGNPYEVQVWTEEDADSESTVPVMVKGTGHQFLDSGTVVGTAVTSVGLVWHVVRYG